MSSRLLVLPLIAFVFVAELMSSWIQRIYFQRTKGRLRQKDLPESEMEGLQHRLMDLSVRLKESLDRLRASSNSPPASSQK